jgi:hypothetical protein
MTGLEGTKAQLISVTDTKKPVIEGVPEPATVACDNIPAIPDVTAGDICDGELVPVFNKEDTRWNLPGRQNCKFMCYLRSASNWNFSTQVLTHPIGLPPECKLLVLGL